MRNRFPGRILSLGGLLAVAAVLALATPAQAHNYYVSSTPGENEVLTTLPEEFTVTTNDNLLDLGGSSGGFVMEIEGPDGLYYGDGCVTVHGSSVSVAAAVGPAGDYTLDWQVVSADGHTVSGQVPFSWQPGADDSSASSGSSVGASTAPHCGTAIVPPGEDSSTPDAAGDSLSDVLWIGGAVVAVAVAAIATFLLLGRKKK